MNSTLFSTQPDRRAGETSDAAPSHSFAPRHLLLVVHDGRSVREVSRHLMTEDGGGPFSSIEMAMGDRSGGSDPRPPTESALGLGSFGAVVADLIDRYPGDWLAWRRSDGASSGPQPTVADVVNRSGLPRRSGEIVHCGLDALERSEWASLGYLLFDDSVFVGGLSDPGQRERRHPSWLLSDRLGFAHCSALQRLGLRSGFETAASTLVDCGLRAGRHGVVVMAEPSWREQAQNEGTTPRSPPARELPRVVRRALGARWLGVWALAMTIWGPRRLVSLASAFGELLTSSSEGSLASATESPVEIRVGGPLEDAAGFPAVAGAAADRKIPALDELLAPRVSVIIPTLGRPHSLRRVLEDCAAQRPSVHQVVVVDQRPGEVESGRASESEALVILDQLDDAPLHLDHLVVPWLGAGRARNVAISRASGDWLLFLDDDVRIAPDAVAKLLAVARAFDLEALCARVLGPEQAASDRGPARGLWLWPGLAGGAALLRTDRVLEIDGFDERLDTGYGEDYELGVRLRRAGTPVATTDATLVIHYHDSVGGFRTPVSQPWDGDEEPKPSPYFLLSRRGLTREMQRGYALTYWLRGARSQGWTFSFGARGLARRFRSARRWVRVLEDRDRGGVSGHRVIESGPGVRS